MASDTPDHAQSPEPAAGQPTDTRGRGWPFHWVWVVILSAALLGSLVGFGVVLRGRSLGPTTTADAASRPTVVIGASASPSPRASPSPSALVVIAASATTTDYVVEPGDTLRSIAQIVYHDSDQWPRIYEANRAAIGADPDALQAGTRLRIP